MNQDFWVTTDPLTFTFELKKGATPFDAITKGVDGTGDCVTAQQIAVLLAAAQVLGADNFNKAHGGALLMTGNPAKIIEGSTWTKHEDVPAYVKELNEQGLQMQKKAQAATTTPDELQKLMLDFEAMKTKLANLTQDKANMVPGDAVNMTNSRFYRAVYPNGAWQSENAVYIGDDKDGTPRFSGLGVDNVSAADLRNTLIKKLESDAKAVEAFIRMLSNDPQLIAFAQQNKMQPADAAKKVFEDSKQDVKFGNIFRIVVQK